MISLVCKDLIGHRSHDQQYKFLIVFSESGTFVIIIINNITTCTMTFFMQLLITLHIHVLLIALQIHVDNSLWIINDYWLLTDICMTKVGYQPGSHMTRSISNQFTNKISALLYYDKYFITAVTGKITIYILVYGCQWALTYTYVYSQTSVSFPWYQKQLHIFWQYKVVPSHIIYDRHILTLYYYYSALYYHLQNLPYPRQQDQ